MVTQKKFKAYDLFPAATLLFAAVGLILVSCHVLIAGMVLSGIGFVGGIVTRVTERKFALNERLAYWAETLGIVLFVVCCLGFAGYTVWDLVAAKDVG